MRFTWSLIEMRRKRAAHVNVPVNPNRQRATSKAATPSKTSTPPFPKVVKESKAPSSDVAEPSDARNHLAPTINFVQKHLTADDVGAMRTKAAVDRMVSVAEANALINAFSY